jgi:curli biogenesis system outer membrane secretion channel CsgG
MYRLVKLLGCLAALSFLVGCATTIEMDVTRPAEVNMAGAKKVAVMDFGVPPENNGVLTYEELWAHAMARALNIQTMRPSILAERIAQYTTGRMVDTLAGTNYFEVVNPGEVSRAVIDSGYRNPDPIMIGQLVGAQAIIVGDITTLASQTDQFFKAETIKDPVSGAESQVNVPWVKRTLTLRLTYRAVNTTTGAIMATKSMKSTNENEARFNDRGSMGPEEEAFRGMVGRMLRKIAKQIAPYQETISRTLMNDETHNSEMKKAEEFVKNRFYDNALRIYVDAWKGSKNPAAGVNAGIMYEVLGDLDSALATVKEVADATAKKEAMEEYNLLLEEKQSQAELMEQLQ